MPETTRTVADVQGSWYKASIPYASALTSRRSAFLLILVVPPGLQSNTPVVCVCRWFGLILLPLVSFSPEAAVAVWCFIANLLGHNDASANKPRPTSLLAHGRPIDLSIQFTLWWMPLLVLFAWWTGKPFHLLFGACPRCR